MIHHRNTGKLELKSEDFCSCLCNQDIPKHSNDIMMASSLTNQPYHQKLTTLQPRGFQQRTRNNLHDFPPSGSSPNSVMSLATIHFSKYHLYFKSSLLIRNVWDFEEAKASLFPLSSRSFRFQWCEIATSSALLFYKLSKLDPNDQVENLPINPKTIIITWKKKIPSLKLTWHLKIGNPKRKFIFQPSIFRCYVSFRECLYH